MSYAIIVKKNKGDKAVSSVLNLIQHYSLIYGRNDFIVCLPGYMSKTKTTLDDFWKQFTVDKSICFIQRGYFFSGMNGKSLMKSSKSTIQDYLNSLYGSYSSSLPQPKDHSKIVIFFKFNEEQVNKETKNIDSLIREGEVKAILLGSSNQSYQTYIKTPADKGEADVLLINNDVFENCDDKALRLIDIVSNSNERKIILTKEISGEINLRDIVDDIFNYNKKDR